ncbi:hypothetical protein FHR20_001228 [Sphingomonas leidyi]|uniref:Uncharacterized protein n=1 Tax=Sphingomonas leidyi TaxID=68569 RepID=A0A7X5UY03_9SPHN|nr:hypothetical protein [Sphingomonas leidyi]
MLAAAATALVAPTNPARIVRLRGGVLVGERTALLHYVLCLFHFAAFRLGQGQKE